MTALRFLPRRAWPHPRGQLARLLFTSLAAAGLFSGAEAQTVCGKRDNIVQQLQTKYGETRRSMGVQGNNVFEVWASEKTGSWTITRTNTRGVTCLMAAGEAFQQIPVKDDPA